MIFGDYYFYGLLPTKIESVKSWWILLPIAVVGGLLGGLFGRFVLMGTLWFNRLYSKNPWRLAFLLGSCCALLGVVSGGLTYGSGYLEAYSILHNNVDAPWYYPLAKAAASWAALISGVPGGLFDPTLSVGASLGQLTAHLFVVDDVRAVVMMFMVAYFAGVVQSPITAFVILIEMTGAHHMVLPLALTAMIACSCSKLVCRQGLYEALEKIFLMGVYSEESKSSPTTK